LSGCADTCENANNAIINAGTSPKAVLLEYYFSNEYNGRETQNGSGAHLPRTMRL
jgi:hypothetical protein